MVHADSKSIPPHGPAQRMRPAGLLLTSLLLTSLSLAPFRAWAQDAPDREPEQTATPAGRAAPEVTPPPSEHRIYPLQWTAKFALRTTVDGEMSAWGALYGGIAFGTLGERWGAFWGVGFEGAGDPLCPADTCAILNWGPSVRAGIAFRETLDGNSYQGRYLYVSVMPYFANGGGAYNDRSQHGIRFSLGFVNPLRLRMVDYFREKDPEGGMWFFQMINSLELIYERCSDRSLHCPGLGSGLLVGFGF